MAFNLIFSFQMPHHCCVPKCTSDSRLEKCKGLSFHCFPKDCDTRKIWIKNIRRDVGKNFALNSHTRVCSLHFDQSCYLPAVMGQERRRLKKESVPTIFEWTASEKKEGRKAPKKREVPAIKIGKRGVKIMSEQVEDNDDYTAMADAATSEGTSTSAEARHEHNDSADSLEHLDSAASPSKGDLLKQYRSVLEKGANEKFSIQRFSSSDVDIRYYTGFKSYRALSCFFQFLQPECNFLYYVGTQNTSQGVPYDTIAKRGPARSLSPLEELFITLVRLRKGLPEKVIADLFDLSEGHVSKILNTWIIFLYDRLRYLPIWPSREHVDKTMPESFKEKYSDTRIIIDCTEIFIEQPSAAVCQRETFSSYKHHNTAKGLLGISPSGQITFISELYAGRCSDKKIVRHCGLYDILEDGDAVMVDKGFNIEDDLNQRGLKLTIPPFLESKQQFTPKQLTDNKSIAAVRVHVERAVRKVKEFEILRNRVPISLCPMLNKTWFVCAHLANFTGSLFKVNAV